jgi:hypothetical protein
VQVGPRQPERLQQVARATAREALDQDVASPLINGEAGTHIAVHGARGSRLCRPASEDVAATVHQRGEEVFETRHLLSVHGSRSAHKESCPIAVLTARKSSTVDRSHRRIPLLARVLGKTPHPSYRRTVAGEQRRIRLASVTVTMSSDPIRGILRRLRCSGTVEKTTLCAAIAKFGILRPNAPHVSR